MNFLAQNDWMVAALLAAGVSTFGTALLIQILRRRAILDLPNDRSLHDIPKPRGGGWAVMLGFAAGLVYLGFDTNSVRDALPLFGGMLILLVVSWMDDRKSLPALPRFGAQIVAVAAGMSTLHGNVFQGLLPHTLDYALAAFGWLWFVNLFNFMDGMDGLASGEALAIGYGLFLLPPHPGAAIVLTASVLGFLAWNWGPSKIMLGDVGSIPLGYVLGAFLLGTAENGYWAAALLLPLYFLIDATFTLLKRALRGEKIWKPHRQHFYQRAVLAGRTHGHVATIVYLLNALLVFCAVGLSPDYPLRAVAIGALSVCLVLLWMGGTRSQATSS